jgi:transposase
MAAGVVIGVDPAKRSHAFEVIDAAETTLAAAVIVNNNAGYRHLLGVARHWPERRWAVEGAGGVGRQLAQRLVADGETVIDVPPKLSTRVRAMTTGHGRKSDPTDARAVALVGLRNQSLILVPADGETVALRLMSERRRELVRTRTQTINRLHQLLMELLPAGAQQHLTAAKAKSLLVKVCPRDDAGKARRQLAADYIDDVIILDRKLKDLEKRIAAAVKANDTSLVGVTGIGAVTAALISARSATSAGFRPRTTSPATPAPPPWKSPAAMWCVTGSRGLATGDSTTHCTSLPCRRSVTTTAAAPTTTANSPPAKAPKAPCAA